MTRVVIVLRQRNHQAAIDWLLDRGVHFERQSHWRRDTKGIPTDIADVVFWIDNPNEAMLFKLAWAGL